MNTDLVSIIIPTYKRSDMLGRAIDSVLNQTYRNIEVIVVDDNDSDSNFRLETEKFMEKYKFNKNIIYIKHEKNMNGSTARNTGINVSKGKYIGFLDDDDEYIKDKVEKQVLELEALSNEFGAVYCGFNIIRGGKKISSYVPTDVGILSKKLLLMEWGTGSGSNVLFKKEVFNIIKGFDEQLSRHQDWDVLLRMFRHFKIGLVKEPLLNIYKDSRINIPNAEKFVEVKKYFLNKFKGDIELYDYKIQNNIYQKHILELSTAFIKNKNYKESFKYYKIAKKYKKIKMKNKLFLFLALVYINIPFRENLLVKFGGIIEKIRLVKS